jgi:hypothetical protein
VPVRARGSAAPRVLQKSPLLTQRGFVGGQGGNRRLRLSAESKITAMTCSVQAATVKLNGSSKRRSPRGRGASATPIGTEPTMGEGRRAHRKRVGQGRGREGGVGAWVLGGLLGCHIPALRRYPVLPGRSDGALDSVEETGHHVDDEGNDDRAEQVREESVRESNPPDSLGRQIRVRYLERHANGQC